MANAWFIYPPHGNFSNVSTSGTVNIYDTLEITYVSLWDALNVTLFCLAGDTATDYQVWQDPSDPLAPNGTFRLESINSLNLAIEKYPTSCSFKLSKYGGLNVEKGGQNFEIVSQPGTWTTYSYTETQTATSATASTPDATSQSAAATSLIATSSPTSSSAVASFAAPSSTNRHSSTTSSTSPASTLSPEQHLEKVELSTGAKAGIGIGVAVVVLVIAALAFTVLRLRRRIHNKPMQEESNKFPSAIPTYKTLPDDKPAPVDKVHELEQIDRAELSGEQRKSVRQSASELE